MTSRTWVTGPTLLKAAAGLEKSGVLRFLPLLSFARLGRAGAPVVRFNNVWVFLGGYSQFGIEFGGFIENSVFYYYGRFSYVADVPGGISVYEDYVGQFAGGDGT
jgi:hypothetical protein